MQPPQCPTLKLLFEGRLEAVAKSERLISLTISTPSRIPCVSVVNWDTVGFLLQEAVEQLELYVAEIQFARTGEVPKGFKGMVGPQ